MAARTWCTVTLLLLTLLTVPATPVTLFLLALFPCYYCYPILLMLFLLPLSPCYCHPVIANLVPAVAPAVCSLLLKAFLPLHSLFSRPPNTGCHGLLCYSVGRCTRNTK